MTLPRKHLLELRRFWVTGLVLLPVLLIACWWLTYGFARDRAFDQADERLNLYASSFEGALDKYGYLPFMLSRQPEIRALLRGESNLDEVHALLEQIAETSGADKVYLLDALGLTLASSNHREPGSFVGMRYAFRPYYREALALGRGELFSVGVTTGEPGYFLSERVEDDDGALLGVAVVKVDLEPLQADWRLAAEHLLVNDANTVVVLSSHPEWKYRSLDPLTVAQRIWIGESQQFNGVHIDPLGNWERGAYRVDTGHPATDAVYLLRVYDLPRLQWQIQYLIPKRQLLLTAWLASAAAFILYILLLTSGLWLTERRRRARAVIASEQALRQANDNLEVQVRQRTAELQTTQKELVQAGKLAALGTLAAGIAHELNQPITAIRTYAATGKKLLQRGQAGAATETLDKVVTLTQRMGHITSQMKVFVRQKPAAGESADWSARIDFVLDMLGERIAGQGVTIIKSCAAQAQVTGDDARIEQILLNLLSNALDAVAGVPEPRIDLSLQPDRSGWALTVEDNGGGLGEKQLEHLFDPFYSTKDVGQGMGLGLFICYGLIQDLGGSIRAGRAATGGARFEVWLPAAPTTNPRAKHDRYELATDRPD